MVSSSSASLRRFFFQACICVILAAMGAVLGGCGISYSNQSKLRNEEIPKAFPCTLLLTTEELERRGDQILCENQVYLIGSQSSPDVLSKLVQFKSMYGASNHPVVVYGRVATEEVALEKGSLKRLVIQIERMILEVVISLESTSALLIER